MARARGRSYSTNQAQAMRKAQNKHVKSPSASTFQENAGREASSSGAQQRASVADAVAVTDSDSGRGRSKNESHEIAVVSSTEKTETSEAGNINSLSWWERIIKRRKQGIENHV
jgi:hypothetical protein